MPDRVTELISKSTRMIMLGMGAGPGADAQYLFSEDVLGHTHGHRPRHAKTYRNFAAEFARFQQERIDAYKEFTADVNTGRQPPPGPALGRLRREPFRKSRKLGDRPFRLRGG